MLIIFSCRPEQRKLKTKYAELVKKVNDSMSKKAK